MNKLNELLQNLENLPYDGENPNEVQFLNFNIRYSPDELWTIFNETTEQVVFCETRQEVSTWFSENVYL